VIQAEVEIVNVLGLHARAAARFVDLATDFSSEIVVAHGSQRANGKSILGLLALAAGRGTILTLSASGHDAQRAVEALADLIESGLGEQDR
jgi:phosphocarrier protein